MRWLPSLGDQFVLGLRSAEWEKRILLTRSPRCLAAKVSNPPIADRQYAYQAQILSTREANGIAKLVAVFRAITGSMGDGSDPAKGGRSTPIGRAECIVEAPHAAKTGGEGNR